MNERHESDRDEWGALEQARLRPAHEMTTVTVGGIIAACVSFGTLNLALPMGPALGCWLVCVVLILGALVAYAEAGR